MSKPAELLQGTLDLLVLRTLELAPLHGVGISDRIEQVTRGVFVVGPGSLFPALHRLAEKGWIEGEWSELENKRRVKVYKLTSSGRAQLSREKGNWKRVLTAVNQVLAEES
jgi:transcriptional regulator